MEFSLDSYKPIDYRTWVLGDEARNGVNLKRLNLLNEGELNLVRISSEYQDCRNDPGHGELVTYFALKLLDYLPGKKEIVVPTAWIHDMGFYGIDSGEWQRLVREARAKGDLESLDDEAKRRPHQNRGCLLAGRFFRITGYPDEKYQFEIADIIGDHDTRKLPTTEGGRIVRAADLLWRVSFPTMQIYFPDLPPEQALKEMEKDAFEKFPRLEGIEADIGRLELANSAYFKFREKAIPALSKYPKELEKIASFYQ